MPMKKGKKFVSKNIAEFHGGKTFAKTKAKFGKKVANKQAVAAGMSAAGMPMRSPMKMRGERGMESYAKSRKK